MNSTIHIIKPGFYTTVQDNGRFGYAHLGIPESGAMDQRAFQFANALLNNHPKEAVLECTLVGPHITFFKDVYFAITGARTGAVLDGEKVMEGVPVFARAGQLLCLSRLTQGSRAYIAFAGGIKTETVLGSRSWYKPVTSQAMLSKGMKLAVGTSNFEKQKGAHVKLSRNQVSEVQTLKVYPGPEYKCLSIAEKEQVQTSSFTVSALWNRMAVQLEERFSNNLQPISTSPVIPGTVQLTPSGKLIILTKDCQVTGGYPRVLQLGQESMNRLAQMQRGNRLLFSIN